MLKNHPRISEIESDRKAGMTLADLATKYSVTRHALGRHFRKPLKPQTLEQQIEIWKQRGEVLWSAAQKNEDVRGMAQSIASAQRGLELQLKRAIELAELAQHAPETDNEKISPGAIDRLLAESANRTDLLAIESSRGMRDRLAAYDPRETAKQRAESAHLALIYHDLFQVFERAHGADPEMRTALLQFAADYQQKREQKSDAVTVDRT